MRKNLKTFQSTRERDDFACQIMREAIIAGFGNRPHIFNLGHGILPETPIENVERLVRLVKGKD